MSDYHEINDPMRGADKENDAYVSDDLAFDEDESVDIKDNDIAVAAPKAKNVLFIALGLLAAIVFLYNIVFSDNRTDAEIEKDRVEEAAEAQPIVEVELASPPEDVVEDDYVAVVDVPEIPEIPDNTLTKVNNNSNIPFINQEEALSRDDLLGELFAQQEEDSQDIIELKEEDVQIFEPLRGETLPAPEYDNLPAPSTPKKTVVKQQISAEEARAIEEKILAEKQRLKDLYSQDFSASPDTAGVSASAGDVAPVYLGTPSKQVVVTSIGNPDDIVGEGKTIEAVLETAINTELQGPVRAIVSRDIYAETGRRVLIPRGSRLSGGYQTALIGDTGCRLSIIWNRIMLPNGTDVTLGEPDPTPDPRIAPPFPSTDQLGRAGICGHVDDKYFETIAGAALLSAVTIAGASIAETISPEQRGQGSQSTTTQPDGAVTVTNNQQGATDQAIIDSLGAFGRTAGGVLTKIMGSGRTIIIPQGARMRVFVQNDIVFPSSRKLLVQ